MATDPMTPATPGSEPQFNEQQVRAMRGDLATPPTPSAAPAAPIVKPPAPVEPTLNVPNKPIFDADEPAFSPNTTVNMSTGSVDQIIAAEGGGKKKIGMILGIVVGVLVLGGVGYFVVYPMLAKPAPATPVAETPVTPTPATPVATAAKHVSAFENQPAGSLPLTIPATADRAAIIATLKAQAPQTGVTELVLADEAQAPAVFAKFMSTVAPSAAPSATTAQLFADDFTAFVYKDEKGVWPGYVASLKPGFSADAIRDWFSGIEKGTVSEFFISDPGKMGAFANGKVNGKYDDRYSSGTAAGASFGYLMLPQQGKVIISTSFTGIKEALRLMGL